METLDKVPVPEASGTRALPLQCWDQPLPLSARGSCHRAPAPAWGQYPMGGARPLGPQAEDLGKECSF